MRIKVMFGLHSWSTAVRDPKHAVYNNTVVPWLGKLDTLDHSPKMNNVEATYDVT
jgi:hypothetical protein